MKILYTLLLLLFTTSLFSQEQFNYTYGNEVSPLSMNVVVLADTGYAVVGASYTNGNRETMISIFDELGQYKSSKHYGISGWDIFQSTENSFIELADSGYVLAASTQHGAVNAVDSSYILLMKFDKNLDTVWTKQYLNDNLHVISYGVTQTPDKGFAIVGLTQRGSNGQVLNSTDALLLKIDSLGIYQWHRNYGSNSSTHDVDHFYKVIPTHDGGYLCGGWTKSWQSHISNYSDKGDMWLTKIDGGGIQGWSRRYGHPDYSELRPSGLIMSSDTSYYFSGGETQYQIGSYDITQSYLLKLDKNFNTVFEKQYGEPSWKNTFFSLIENEDGDLLLPAYFQDNYGEQNTRGNLYKLNSDGDSIWKRQYVGLDTLNPNCSNYPYSIKQTSDGGYIFTGITSYSSLNPAQQVWLVKTDQYGCDGTNWWTCATNIAVNEYVSNPGFSVFPNPAREQLTINIPSKAGISSPKVEIYNLTGKLVKQMVRLSGDEARRGTVFPVDVSNLEKGLYIVKVGQQTQKLVVE